MLRYCKCAPASREGTVTHSVGVWGAGEGWVGSGELRPYLARVRA